MGWILGPGYRQTALQSMTLSEICITYVIEDIACVRIFSISVFLSALDLDRSNQLYQRLYMETSISQIKPFPVFSRRLPTKLSLTSMFATKELQRLGYPGVSRHIMACEMRLDTGGG